MIKIVYGILRSVYSFHKKKICVTQPVFSNLFDFSDEEDMILNQGVPMMMIAICKMARQEQNQSQKVPKFNTYVWRFYQLGTIEIAYSVVYLSKHYLLVLVL